MNWGKNISVLGDRRLSARINDFDEPVGSIDCCHDRGGYQISCILIPFTSGSIKGSYCVSHCDQGRYARKTGLGSQTEESNDHLECSIFWQVESLKHNKAEKRRQQITDFFVSVKLCLKSYRRVLSNQSTDIRKKWCLESTVSWKCSAVGWDQPRPSLTS